MEKKSKFITIKQINNEIFENKPVFRVYNNKSNEQLAMLSFYKPWKKYVFSSKDGCVFDLKCLNEVMKFMEDL